jgi:lysophospholipase L1-like esterase
MAFSYSSALSAPLAAGLLVGFLSSTLSAQGNVAVKTGAKIAFLGDSITAGGARGPAGYCKLVIRGLKSADVEATMIPAGISGHKSNQMLARLEKDVLAKKPDWMTLSCGVNDVWHGARGVLLPDYKKNITEIVSTAQAKGIKVMILTSTMIRENQDDDLNQKLLPYNEFLKQLAADKNCLFADLNADMQAALITGTNKPKGNQLTGDGVHMNALGNIMMATGVLRAFGLSDAQLAKATAEFETIPNSCEIRVNTKMNVQEFGKLRAAATKAGMSVQKFVQQYANQRVAELLKRL